MTDKPENQPAFPTPFLATEAGRQYAERFGGMLLRDYFAASVRVPPDLDIDTAQALIGRLHPHNDPVFALNREYPYLEVQKFWADAEAAFRGMRADAMLAARREAEELTKMMAPEGYWKLCNPDAPPAADLVARLKMRQGEYAEQGSASVLVVPPDHDAHDAAAAIEALRAERGYWCREATRQHDRVKALEGAIKTALGDLGCVVMLPSGGVGCNPVGIVNSVRAVVEPLTQALAAGGADG